MTEFDFAGTFDEDYLYFYEQFLTPERNAEEVETVAGLLEGCVEILDCPCGHGRIANGLAERGLHVTGLDASELFLEHARADAQARGVDVDYARGDMRELPWTEQFDGLLNWFTSFGYFDDDENRQVLRQFHDALRPGGRLVMETMNIARLMLNFRPQHWDERGDDFMLDKVELDLERARTNTERIIIRGGRVRRTHFVVRYFSFAELADWLRAAGFENVRTPGITTETRLVVVADRPAS
jgi:2-polyprenyl-3-methyl-5-hydroxy-6-metoxy-1,4-benzoquinol methylase